jgi:hypothetical protein
VAGICGLFSLLHPVPQHDLERLDPLGEQGRTAPRRRLKRKITYSGRVAYIPVMYAVITPLGL